MPPQTCAGYDSIGLMCCLKADGGSLALHSEPASECARTANPSKGCGSGGGGGWVYFSKRRMEAAKSLARPDQLTKKGTMTADYLAATRKQISEAWAKARFEAAGTMHKAFS